MRPLRSLRTILGICAVLTLPCYSAEPSYGGKTLSEWLSAGSMAPSGSEIREQANGALRSIGTNAIPYLLQWGTNNAAPRRNYALGFQALGSSAAPAIPILVERLLGTNEEFAVAAASSLNQIGDCGLPVLLNAITNRHSGLRTSAIMNLELGPKARHIIPCLLRDLDDSNAYYRWRAAEALGSIHLEAYRVVPKLSKLLQDKDPYVRYAAVTALERFQAFADSARPAIAKLQTDEYPWVRNVATYSLHSISNAVTSIHGQAHR